MTFHRSTDARGIYIVRVGSLTGSFEVEAAGLTSRNAINWWLVGAGVSVITALSVIVSQLIRQREA